MNRYSRIPFALLAVASAVIAFALAPSPGRGIPFALIQPVADIEGGDDDPGARLQYDWARLHDPVSGVIPENIREQELAFAAGIPRRPERLSKPDGGSSVLATAWEKRGPINVGG